VRIASHRSVHVDRMSVPKLMRRKSAPDACFGRRVMQLLARR
jgi:hypothetical protein